MEHPADFARFTGNKHIQKFVAKYAKLCTPKEVVFCDGSEEEYRWLCQQLVDCGTFIKLSDAKRPDSFLARSDPSDVARVESRTFICTTYEEDSGPTNNWADPDEMMETLHGLLSGAMEGRTCYVVPFCMGPIDSPLAKCGIQLTDSAYVVVNTRIMTRMGKIALDKIGRSKDFVPCVHSVGMPLKSGARDVPWPCNATKYISHFPEISMVISFGSGYGGNALTSKKCFALRIASSMGREHDWMAEHCLILGITNPDGAKRYIVAAMPSQCGKTNLAQIISTVPGYSFSCLGDDIAWMYIAPDGRLHAINPETGFFGVAPGTNDFNNPAAMEALKHDAIFTNVALTNDGDVWWEGLTEEPPQSLSDWTGQPWTPTCGRVAAHPNARYTVPVVNLPVLDKNWDAPEGVPVSAILFGGRRSSTIPLVSEAFSWEHGVFNGSMCCSEMTAASEGVVGRLRIDSFAMKPFVGYNMADYFKHWLDMGAKLGKHAPGIFYVNWFRRDPEGKFLWPGFSENSRVLKWIFERLEGTAKGVHTPIGIVPAPNALDLHGLAITKETVAELLEVNARKWLNELPQIREYQRTFEDHLPEELRHELTELELRLHFATHDAPTTNAELLKWVQECVAMCKPQHVYWCDGSQEEYSLMCDVLVEAGTFIKLNEKKRPNSYLARSDPSDVARVESRTFICTPTPEEAGPLNNWHEPVAMRKVLASLYDGCMSGRTCYIVPFAMGPLDSPYTRFGIEITDSPYVVLNMHVMARVGYRVLRAMGSSFYLKCLHSVGKPLRRGEKDVAWPCNETKYICHFGPQEPMVMSFGSQYGGNAILGKKCYALRIASMLARREGWLAEHMLVLKWTSPVGRKMYIAAAFPSSCGKTNLAMLISTLGGQSAVTVIGDDIAWMHINETDGKLYAINPEAGFFGVAPGTSNYTNRSAMETLKRDCIFTNVGLTSSGDVWWEGMTEEPPAHLMDWTGQPWTPDCGRKAAHPNSRYTCAAKNCPAIDPDWENPEGVPISAIVFGGRRSTTVPLCFEAFDWNHGVFCASMCASEQTAASEGTVGKLRFDPFAMKPFCGYNFGDYVAHWLKMGERLGQHAPKIYYVNWFRKSEDGTFLWPGYGENCRVLQWISDRIEKGKKGGRYTPIGIVPTADALDTAGLRMTPETLSQLLYVNPNQWIEELAQVRNFHSSLGSHWPAEMHHELTMMEQRLYFSAMKAVPTTNVKVIEWVQDMLEMCTPDHVHWCDGSEEEYQLMCDLLVESGTLVRLNPKKRPNSFLARADPGDVARVESCTYICSTRQEDAGPLNNWRDPEEMKKELVGLFSGSMRGRTMYIIGFQMGPFDSPYSRFGVQITDSPYVVANMHIMTRMGFRVLKSMSEADFVPCLHSVGRPLKPGEKDSRWPCNNEKKRIVHFPDWEMPTVWSYGSGFGGNSILAKKCFALRIASVLARKEGWMAEHMLILGFTSPSGKEHFVAAALPSACGKTNLSMMVPTPKLAGYKVRVVGDDIAWIHIGDDGRLWAINPEAGFFGVAPGTSDVTNHSAMETLKRDCLFTNVALTPDGDVWWEGMSLEPPPMLEDWTYQKWTPTCGRKAAHPNARYTCRASLCPVLNPKWDAPEGVPLSAIVFGGRRATTIPLCTEARSWNHGVFMGSVCSSEQTAASEGTVGALRIDSMAMRPFIGYDAGSYFQHWVDIGAKLGDKAPKIFYVNWFRKSADGTFLWPGFQENGRVLKWICDRVDGIADAVETEIGFLPTADAIDTGGLRLEAGTMDQLLEVDREAWAKDVAVFEDYLGQFGAKLPQELAQELQSLKVRLASNNCT